MRYVLIMLLLLPAMAWAESSSKWPTEIQSSTNWTDGGEATGANDNVCASYASTSQDPLITGSYEFSIPTGATIDSVHLTGYHSGTGSPAPKRQVDMAIAIEGTPGAYTAGLDGGEGECTPGAIVAKYTTGLPSVSEANSSAFGGAIIDTDNKADGTIYIDALQITIYYTEAATGVYPGQTIIIGGQ